MSETQTRREVSWMHHLRCPRYSLTNQGCRGQIGVTWSVLSSFISICTKETDEKGKGAPILIAGDVFLDCCGDTTVVVLRMLPLVKFHELYTWRASCLWPTSWHASVWCRAPRALVRPSHTHTHMHIYFFPTSPLLHIWLVVWHFIGDLLLTADCWTALA